MNNTITQLNLFNMYRHLLQTTPRTAMPIRQISKIFLKIETIQNIVFIDNEIKVQINNRKLSRKSPKYVNIKQCISKGITKGIRKYFKLSDNENTR